MKGVKITLAAIFSIAMIFTPAAFAQTDITSKFGDEKFLRIVRDALGIGTSSPVYKEDVEKITELNITNSVIGNFAGMEFFTGLTTLKVSDMQFGEHATLDVSKNTALTTLDVSGNRFTTLDVSKNTALTTLNASNNLLTALDVSKNTKLKTLNVSNNRLCEVIGWNGDIGTQYRGGDITIKFTDPKFLECVRSTFQISANSPVYRDDVNKSTILGCNAYHITSLAGIEYFTSLTRLIAASNQITEVDVSKNTALELLVLSSNKLTSIDVSKNAALATLLLTENQLTSIDVSKNIWLNSLVISGNQLTSIDVSKNTALIDLQLGGNVLTSLDVSKNTALKILDAKYNQFTEIDLSKNVNLDSLYINNNKFISIDVSKNTALKTLNAHHNKLTVLNLSANTALTNLDVSYNYLSYVTGWSGDIGFQYLLGDISGDFTDENFLNKVRSTLGITVDAPIYKENVGGITSLNVRNSNIKNLAGIEHLTALKVLDASNNQLTEIDISKNTALTTLLLTSNKLASIDVTKNTALNWLDVSDNQLTSIDVSKNTALDDFKVNNNKLTTLSVKNLNLSSFDCSYNYLKQVTGWSGDIGFQYEPTPILKIATASSILAHAMGNSIVLQNLPSGAKVEVFDLRGKLISGKSFNRGNRGSDMSISVHAKGVYIVKVSSGSAKQVVRVAVR